MQRSSAACPDRLWVQLIAGPVLLAVASAVWAAPADESGEQAPNVRYIQAEPSDDFLDLGDLPSEPPAADTTPDDTSTTPTEPAADAPAAGRSTPTDPKSVAVLVPAASNDELLSQLDRTGTREVLTRYSDNSLKCRMWLRDVPGQEPQRHGPYVEFYRGQAKFCEGLYVDGKREGVWKFYFRDGGQLAKQGEYRQDKAIGTWYVLRPQGTVERVENYVDGRQEGRWTTFGPDGQLVLQIRQFRGGQPHGLWESWYAADRKRFEIEFSDGIRDGRVALWYPNGNKWLEGQFEEGLRHGRWTWWNQAGQVQKRGVFNRGELVLGNQEGS